MLLRPEVRGQRIARGERRFADRARAIGKTGTGLLQGLLLMLLRLLRLLLLLRRRLREKVLRTGRSARTRAGARARVAAIAAVALVVRGVLRVMLVQVVLLQCVEVEVAARRRVGRRTRQRITRT